MSFPESRDRAAGHAPMSGAASMPEGVLRLHIEIRVSMEELRAWRPNLMAAFLEGIAMMERARAAAEWR
jgi:hypothetical protein